MARNQRGDAVLGRGLTSRDEVTAVMGCDSDRNRLLGRFDGYADFAGSYIDPQPDDVKRLLYVRKFESAGRQVAILGLNSAWLSASNQDETVGLVVGEWQARHALDLAGFADMRFALLHHPLDLLRSFDRKITAALLKQNCDFILHGHLHEAEITSVTGPDSSTAVIAGGGVLQSPRLS